MNNIAATYLEQGRVFLLAGDPQRAIELLQKAKTLCSDNPVALASVLTELAAAYRRAGRSEDARNCEDQERAIAPPQQPRLALPSVSAPARVWRLSVLVPAASGFLVIVGVVGWLLWRNLAPFSTWRVGVGQESTQLPATRTTTTASGNGAGLTDREQLIKDDVGKLLVMCEYSGKIEGQNAKIDLPIAGGSCFAIRSDGYLLTNYHVVNLSRDPEDTLKEFGYPDMGRDRVFFVACFGPDSVDHIEVSLYAHSDRIDLAILKAPRTFTHPLSLSGEHIHQGDEVFAAGFPGSVDDFLRKMNPMSVSKDKIVLRTVQTGRYDGTELFDKDSFLPQLNRGIVSAVRRTVDNTACVEFDAGISHGNSGGPLLDGKNNVLGMVTYGLGDAGTPTDNFAISAEELRTELDRLVEPVNSNPPVRPVR